MMKGSPEGYNIETGFAEPDQPSQTGEPNERTPQPETGDIPRFPGFHYGSIGARWRPGGGQEAQRSYNR
jgi:hypothetical protein